MGRDLQGRVAVVTGAGRGIGRAIAQRLAEDGAAVVIAERDARTGAQTADELTAQGRRAAFFATDVGDSSQLNALAAFARERFGRVSILVNNAARYADLGRRPFWEIADGEFDDVMRINVRGAFAATRALTEQLRDGGGAVVNIASATFHHGTPDFIHYVASKGAVIGMTRVMARELGRYGVRVNAIAPGLIDTEATMQGRSDEYLQRAAAARAIPRIQHAEDLVGTIAFLCSDDAAFITGQTLVVDGGVAFV
jgi:NAD(P)-dependent dehydrogenase (short-subunit alcohol dehydrogenase family)